MDNYKVYVHKTQDNKYYVGVTKQDINRRWRNGKAYNKNKELSKCIDKYGWDGIEHIVLYEHLEKEEALIIEDELICKYMEEGCCLNENRSGYIEKNNKNAYNRMLYKENLQMREHCQYCSQEWKEQHKEQVSKYGHIYYESHKNEKKQYNEEYRRNNKNKPEYKIYNRVNAYNHLHKDNIIETALEARNKYIEYGYIPDYIKNDDIKVA